MVDVEHALNTHSQNWSLKQLHFPLILSAESVVVLRLNYSRSVISHWGMLCWRVEKSHQNKACFSSCFFELLRLIRSPHVSLCYKMQTVLRLFCLPVSLATPCSILVIQCDRNEHEYHTRSVYAANYPYQSFGRRWWWWYSLMMEQSCFRPKHCLSFGSKLRMSSYIISFWLI